MRPMITLWKLGETTNGNGLDGNGVADEFIGIMFFYLFTAHLRGTNSQIRDKHEIYVACDR